LAYTWITFASAKQQLAALLSDSTNSYWSDAECGVYLVEALRTWGATTGYWSDRGIFNTTAGTAFYDITSVLNDSGVLLRGYNVTDTSLVSTIQYHLLEPATGTSWIGTDQFNLSDVTNALQRRRNQFLLDTGCVVAHSTQSMTASPIGRIVLPDITVLVRRVDWTTPEGYVTHVWKSDEWAMGAARQSWNLEPSSPPQTWSMAVTNPLTIQLAPPPSDSGSLDFLTIQSGANLNPAAGVLMGIPDDYCWAVKFGALADLLSKDGPARDPQRAQYCEGRYQEGVRLASTGQSVLQTWLNGQLLWTEALRQIDAARRNWMSKRDTPDVAATAGLNMLALANVPDAIYGVVVDVTRNSIVPASDGEFLQIGREEFEAVLGYSQHLACFKLGGEEFASTSSLYQRFMRIASVYNRTANALVMNEDALTNVAQDEPRFRPLRQPAEVS